MSIFAGLLGPRIALAERPIADAPEPLFAETARAVADAVEKRRREFLTGRACAHDALTALGAPATALLPGTDRLPAWPEGFTGSITHTDHYCAAAALRTGNGIRSIGIDLEPDEPLPDDLWEMICRPEEAAMIAALAPHEQGLYARALFSAKECAFKAQFPLTRTMLEFSEVGVALDLADGRFEATYMRGAPVSSARGRIRVGDGFIATALTL